MTTNQQQLQSVDATGDDDKTLAVDVLLKLNQQDSPPPPPPQELNEDDDEQLTVDWSIRRRRSRKPAGNRGVKPESGSSDLSIKSDTDSKSEGVAANSTSDLIVGGGDDTGRRAVRVAGVSRLKAASAEPSGKAPTKRRKNKKREETLRAFMEEYRRKNKDRRAKKKKPIPDGEPQGSEVAVSAETQGSEVVVSVEAQGSEVAVSAEAQGSEVAVSVEAQGPEVAVSVEAQGPEVVVLDETQGAEVVVSSEILGAEVVASGEIQGPEKVAAGEPQEKTDDHDHVYVLPDLNIPFVDDTFQ